MMPGYPSSETAFKRYQEQLHQQIQDPIRSKIEFFMTQTGQITRMITEEDIADLYEMAALFDPYGDRKIVERINELNNLSSKSLYDRETFAIAKGIIEGYIREEWYSENRPTNTTADAIQEAVNKILETSHTEYLKEHPEVVEKLMPIRDLELLQQEIENLTKQLSEMEDNYDKLKKILDEQTKVVRPEPKTLEKQEEKDEKIKQEIKQETKEKNVEIENIKDKTKTLKFKTERIWQIGLNEITEEPDIEFEIKYPENYSNYLPLIIAIRDEEHNRTFAQVEFQVMIKDKESFDMFINRLKKITLDFLLTGEINTPDIVHNTFTENMRWYPKTYNGKIAIYQIGKIETMFMKEEQELIISIGKSYIKYYIFLTKKTIEPFIKAFVDVIEMITASAEELEVKKA